MLAKKKLSVMVLSLAFASSAFAGLGGIAVRSNLGEPLRAEIDFSGSDGDLLRVGLASPDTFKDLKVEYTGILNSLRFTLAQRSNGRSYIRVTSNAAVSDPYLRFVVEARMPNGRSIREYTILLDPVDYEPRQQVAKPAPVPVFVPETPAAGKKPVLTPSLPVRPSVLGKSASTPDNILVRPGQTLQSIASRLSMPGASQRQIMAAIVQENPGAFTAGDPSKLKAGSRLRVPGQVKAKGLSAAEVDTILRARTESSAQVVEPAKPAQAMPKPAAAPVAPTPVPEQVVKLEPVDTGASAAHAEASSAALSEQALLLQQAQKKITELEERLKAMQATSAAKAVAPAAHEEEIGPSFLDSIMDFLPAIGAAVAAGLLGVAGLILYRRRKSKKGVASNLGAVGAMLDQDSVEKQNLEAAAGGNTFLTDFTRTGMPASEDGDVDPIAEAEVYLAYGRDQQAEEILKDALNKDPTRHDVRAKLLEVYAARQDKQSFEHHAKSLHAAMDGQGSIWEKAAKLGRSIDLGNPLYGAVAAGAVAAETGSGMAAVDIDLDNELMGMSADEPKLQAPAPVEDLDDDLLRAALLGDEPAIEATPVPDSEAAELDIEALLDAEPETEEPPANEDKHMLDFDFQLDDLPAPIAEPVEVSPPADDNSVDFDFGLDVPDLATEAAAEETPAVSTEGLSVSDDPLATRLDLARVYLDMGDKDGAREVLEDLVAEADGTLKKEAETLLATL